jgi:hypothetical protein
VTFNFSIARGRWFSPGTSASSTTKTGRHDIAESCGHLTLNNNHSLTDSGHFCFSIYY